MTSRLNTLLERAQMKFFLTLDKNTTKHKSCRESQFCGCNTNNLKQGQPILVGLASAIHQEDNTKCIQQFHCSRICPKNITQLGKPHDTYSSE